MGTVISWRVKQSGADVSNLPSPNSEGKERLELRCDFVRMVRFRVGSNVIPVLSP
jgi:hypothetical protein